MQKLQTFWHHTLFPKAKKHWPVFAIAGINILLFITNYKPGTFLIGWDNLYPELEPFLNIKRSFFATWQEYRNLGYMDGMSHAANLFHDIARWLMSLIMPLHLVRWVTIFGTHFIGGVGMYYLLQRYVFRSSHAHKRATYVSLFGALFYQYNLITVQQYFLPYELFLFHFALLPWLVFFTLLFMEYGKKKHLIAYSGAMFLSIPQAHVPTIFIVTVMILAFVMISKLIIMKGSSWKQVALLVLVSFTINAYWGIPFAYSTSQNANIIAESKNNQMATDNIYYLNLKYGSFSDVALLKGVVLDYKQFDIQLNRGFFMMAPWIEHMFTLPFRIPAWTFFVLTVLGVIGFLLRREAKYIPFFILFVFSFAMMAVNTPGVSLLSDFLREYIPLFHNVFRFVFTKFAFFYVFSYTIFLALGLYYLLTYTGHIHTYVRRIRYLQHSIFTVMSVMLILYTLPSFQQNFFYKNLAATIPDAYFDTFDFFADVDKDDRIALLPIPWYWAWTQNNWNTIGSGFFWYGLEQPTTDRAFDPWSDKNEGFYWELEQAVFADNMFLIENVLDKYDIRWLLLDKSVYNNSSPKFTLSEYENLLNTSSRITLTEQNDFISIYQYEPGAPRDNSRLQLKSDLPVITPSYDYDNVDMAYLSYGDYVSKVDVSPDVYYPFRSLFSGRKPQEREFTVKETERYISFESPIPSQETNLELHLPEIYTNEFITRPDPDDLSATVSAQMRITYGDDTLFRASEAATLRGQTIPFTSNPGDTLSVTFTKESLELYTKETDDQFFQRVNNGCLVSRQRGSEASMTRTENALTLTSVGSDNCLLVPFSFLSHNAGYLMFLEASNSDTRGLFINLINNTTRKSDLETYLDHDGKRQRYNFVLPPRAFDGLGYDMIINNQSIATEKVENSLIDIDIYQIPYFFLKELTVQPEDSVPGIAKTYPSQLLFSQHNPTLYTIDLPSNLPAQSPTLYLSQSYSDKWLAYGFEKKDRNDLSVLDTLFPFIFGTKIEEHVLVNNWANGWELTSMELGGETSDNTSPSTPNSQLLTLIFWPQYLQYVGLILTMSTLGILWIIPSRKRTKHPANFTPLRLLDDLFHKKT